MLDRIASSNDLNAGLSAALVKHSPFDSIIGLSSSQTDLDSVLKLLELMPKAYMKTVKFIEHPQGIELSKQIKSLQKKLPDFINAQKNLNLTLKQQAPSQRSQRKVSLNPKLDKRPDNL